MHLKYDRSIDRFFVSNSPDINFNAGHVALTNINEYLRYIPLNDVSLESVNDFLSTTPYEVCFEITDRCNYSCPVCDLSSKNIKIPVILSFPPFSFAF